MSYDDVQKKKIYYSLTLKSYALRTGLNFKVQLGALNRSVIVFIVRNTRMKNHVSYIDYETLLNILRNMLI